MAAVPHQTAEQPATAPAVQQASAARLAHDDLRGVLLLGHAQESARDVGVSGGDHFRPQFARQGQMPGQAGLVFLGERLRLLDINGQPGAVVAVRQPARPTDHVRRIGAGADGHEQAVAGLPRPGDLHGLQIIMHLLPDVFRRQTQGHFAQGVQIALAEEIHHGQFGALRQIDFAFIQPLEQFVRRQVNQLDFGAIQHAVGHGFMHGRAGDLAHGVNPAFGVLHIHGGEDVNAGIEQFDDILVALGVAGAGDVGVGQFIHQRQLRVAGQQGVQVHFLQHHAAILGLAPRDDGQPGDQGVGLLPSVRLDIADDDVAPLALGALGGAEHGVGLADTGGHAKEDLELAAFFRRLGFLDGGQQRIGIGTKIVCHKPKTISLGGNDKL